MSCFRSAISLCAVVFCAASLNAGDVTLIGVASIPGDQTDLSGLNGKLSDGVPRNRLGGYGSSIAYTGVGTTYIMASDRGPHDGASDYQCRFHTFDVQVSPGALTPVTIRLTGTKLLVAEPGKPYVGSTTAFDLADPSQSRRFDPEGVRVGPNGTVIISDEYGPFVVEFDRKGQRLKSYAVPTKFLPEKPSGKPEEEMPPNNRVGRQPNRGMEGLAISPSGDKLFGIMQSPLIQDGALDKDNKRIGLNCRLLEINRKTGSTRELVYQLDDAANGVSEILAADPFEFLVLERDSKGGQEAAFKKLFIIDIGGATDVSPTDKLPTTKLPSGIRPVKKKLFLDLLDPEFRLAGDSMPEKIEGIAFGPDLPDGRRLLLVTADNDFVATAPFRIYAFAVARTKIPGFEHQRFDGVK